MKKCTLIISATLIFSISVILLLLLPRIYRSNNTIPIADIKGSSGKLNIDTINQSQKLLHIKPLKIIQTSRTIPSRTIFLIDTMFAIPPSKFSI